MQIITLEIFVQPHKIGVEFTTGKIFHCLEIGFSFARENYIAFYQSLLFQPQFVHFNKFC